MRSKPSAAAQATISVELRFDGLRVPPLLRKRSVAASVQVVENHHRLWVEDWLQDVTCAPSRPGLEMHSGLQVREGAIVDFRGDEVDVEVHRVVNIFRVMLFPP